MTDTQGWLLTVRVHSADQPDCVAAQEVLEPLVGCMPRLEIIWADMGYISNALADWTKKNLNATLTILKHPWQGRQTRVAFEHAPDPPVIEKPRGFVVLKKRWVVERSFAWLTHARRLLRSHEFLPLHEESFIYVAMIRLMLRRLTECR